MKKLKWTTEKPNKPCIFVTKTKDVFRPYEYKVWSLVRIKNLGDEYLAWLDDDGEEYDDFSLYDFGEYLIIDFIEEERDEL